MGIEAELNEAMKTAMRAKDKRTLDVVRMVKSKGLERKTAAGYHGGELSEQDWIEIVSSYVKQLQKSVPEFEKAGEAGHATVEQLKHEIGYLERWLPAKLDEAGTRSLVDAAIAEMGAKDPRQVGQVMGRIMKEHKDSVDSGLVRRLAEQRLTELASGA
jgi:uncharacterized protein